VSRARTATSPSEQQQLAGPRGCGVGPLSWQQEAATYLGDDSVLDFRGRGRVPRRGALAGRNSRGHPASATTLSGIARIARQIGIGSEIGGAFFDEADDQGSAKAFPCRKPGNDYWAYRIHRSEV
jgi:hypothetical protein